MREFLQSGKQIKYFLMLCFVIACSYAHAQQVVSGTVKDEKTGELLPGVNVVLKGTSTGTISDGDGKYSLEVSSSDAILIFSFVGYAKTEVPVAGRSSIDILLASDVSTLDEVVVVGYGTQKKSVVSGSISSVKASDLESMPINRIEQALQGRTSGLTIAANSGQPGEGATVRLRGITSFNRDGGGNNQPLWVVDGVIIDNGGIGYLNQSDIESIEVLKDAASQAIYGARAAAGVILVTTKKGKAGTLKMNYNGYYGISEPARKLDLLNASQYATLRNEAAAANGDPLPYANPESYGEGTDWQSLIFNKSAKRQNHEFSISGGNEKSTFYTSFGYLSQEGIVATDISKYKRFNIRLNSTHKAKKWLTIGQNLGYAYNKSIGLGNTNSEFGGPLSSAINLDPITPAVITDPAVASLPLYANNPVRRDENGNPYGISTTVGQEMTNPLAYISKQLGNYGWAHNIIGNFFLEAEPVTGLKFRSTVGAKLAFYGNESFTPEYFLNSSNIVSQNSFSRENNTRLDWNLENTISYTRSIGDHNVTALIGQGAYLDDNTKMTRVTFNGIPADNFDDASFNYKVPATQRTSDASEGQDHTVSSLFARVNYDYKEKYLVSALVRRDGSSRFGQNYRFGIFPSFSLGWVPSLENFWIENNVVNFLKIRGSYGVVGNDNIGNFSFLSTIGSGRNYTIGTSGSYLNGFSPNAPANPDLRWEETTSTNIGFEATILEDFTLTFDWYKKATKDILQNPRIPFYVGAISNPAANVADMENSGIELELGWRKQVGEVNLGFNGNFSYLKNKVTFLGNGIEFLTDGNAGFQGSAYSITRTEVGHTYNSFYGFQTQGIFQTQEEIEAYVGPKGKIQPNARPGDFRWEDINGDGVINENDRKFLGNPMPKYTFGFTLSAAYKGFDVVLFAQGVAGNKIFQGLRRFGIPSSNWQTEALGRWTGPGTSNTYPRLITNDPNNNLNNPSDFYLKNGNYFRIKTLQIGYTLPKALVAKAGLEKTRIYVMSENLATFTKYNGYDPEIGGGTMSIDRGIYPQARSFMVGLTVGF
ncbi:SusC/RagA family TonB-linked outer membrane protein [Ohtaekwangia koreensis]|uniref:TonB-linked outer membrane protein, SusC/RagA family n=1 Tax=Ohtaekwangia koreensis TaxID=688867 RepID=A0A1T5MNP0_9BACT|nr:TonB-dependent receptor [Ohtaekwangia koreensis]SKC89528.1 TonB-linked outer membrane protein, SusC/RagA family [Ohtaekwangia koreensis]